MNIEQSIYFPYDGLEFSFGGEVEAMHTISKSSIQLFRQLLNKDMTEKL